MFNITINLKRVLKKLLIFFIICIFILVFFKYSKVIINYINTESTKIIESEILVANSSRIDNDSFSKVIIEDEFPKFAMYSNNKDEYIEDYENKLENIENNIEEIKSDNKSEQAVIENSENLENKIDYTNLKTEVINENNIKENYNVQYNGVKIKNESNYDLTDDMLEPNIDFINKKDIIIFHTHTCESYTQTDENKYKESGNFRTIDLNYSVAKVGDELTKELVQKSYNVIHDTTFHDYPAYTGSYNRSLLTVKGLMEKNPEVQLVIDLHRDAIGSKSEYGPCVKIGEEKVAQLMFVIGTDGGGLEHPNWNTNLKYAIKIQEKANEMFPGLFRPIIVRNSRYNQNLADGACIIEVGATGNTLEESMGSMKYLAEVLEEVLK